MSKTRTKRALAVEEMIDEVAELQCRMKNLREMIDRKKAAVKRYQMDKGLKKIITSSGHSSVLAPNTRSVTDRALAQDLVPPEVFVRIFRTETDADNPKHTVR